MGHFCRICKRNRPNEKFTRKGYKNHICKDCSHRSPHIIEEIEHNDEIFGYLKQSHISKKNIARLRELVLSNNQKISELAGIVLEVAQIKPYKKRRLKVLSSKRKDLLKKLEETGLILAHHD